MARCRRGRGVEGSWGESKVGDSCISLKAVSCVLVGEADDSTAESSVVAAVTVASGISKLSSRKESSSRMNGRGVDSRGGDMFGASNCNGAGARKLILDTSDACFL